MKGMGVELTDCGQGLGSFPGGSVVKKKIHLPIQDMWFLSLHWEDPLQKEMATHSSVFLPVESCGQMSLAGYRSWGLKESDTTEHLGTQVGRQEDEGPTPETIVLSDSGCGKMRIQGILGFFLFGLGNPSIHSADSHWTPIWTPMLC